MRPQRLTGLVRVFSRGSQAFLRFRQTKRKANQFWGNVEVCVVVEGVYLVFKGNQHEKIAGSRGASPHRRPAAVAGWQSWPWRMRLERPWSFFFPGYPSASWFKGNPKGIIFTVAHMWMLRASTLKSAAQSVSEPFFSPCLEVPLQPPQIPHRFWIPTTPN